ncbi:MULTISPECIES: LysE family translocator [unclassified Nonomuraea]|uniref:LysE family translocator n=1 Tax=unclassified Nonomuraea TaxID=2593643 RepID=UPI0033D9D9CC
MQSLLAAVAVLALLTVVPGPDMAVVSSSALSGGRRAAIQAAAGVVTGLLVWGMLAVVGLAAVLAASTQAYTVVRIAGAVYLVVLGLQAWWRSRKGTVATSERTRSSLAAGWRAGLVTNLLNPKIAVFYTSLLPQLIPADAPATVTTAGLVLTHGMLSLAWLTTYALLLDRFRPVLNRPRIRRLLERVTGTVLIGFGLRLATEGR